ncbi:MDR family MFS transporter [Peterkaempfera sp. SMS 1(5)a]|uniref:MDR family MFS transporter n=1 Tax=Peterkaempfera podocarpi TaxID=3232308 RepID=UPI00366D3A2D
MDQLIAGDPPRIGPYRLIARLGAGGMGLVYLGRSEHGRTVAVKVVQAEYAGHPEFRRRFAREVGAARRVGGNWTAAVLDADPEAAVPWVATQYIPGPDLHTVVAKDFGPLPEYSVRVLANRLALALQAVHGAGLIHRDLKPSNVLITVDGPRVIDFGIARAMDTLAGDSLHTHTGMLIGSPGFMSPEQVRGLELTPASDVFCLGAVLVYAATGRLLFGATDTGLNAHLFRIAEEEADLTGVPEGLVDLVRACLHKDPAERPGLQEVAERTAPEQTEEWLPSPVLAQLGRHAAELLDYAPSAPVDAPPAQPTPFPDPASPPPPVYTPTAPAHFGPAGFGPPQSPYPSAWPAPPPHAAPQDPPPPHPRRWWGLAVVALAQLMVAFQAAAFSMALPVVQRDLHLTSGQLSPLVNTYTLAFAGLLVLGGHVADLVGRRRTLVIGLVGFAAASMLSGTASGSGMLLACRALQGFSAALVTAAALSLVVSNFTDPKERRRAFGVYVAFAGGGGALGLCTGGWLVESLDWRLSLLASVPVAVITLIGALTLLHDGPTRNGAPFDPVGALLGSFGLLAVTYGLTRAGSHGWSDILAVVMLLLGVPMFAAFLWWGARASNPVVPPPDVRDNDRLGSLVALVLAGTGIFALFSALSYFLERVLGYSPMMTGETFLALAVALAIGSTQVSARLLGRASARALIVAGMAVMALGLVLATGAGTDGAHMAQVLPGLLLTGFGAGLAFVPIFVTASSGMGAQRAGAVSATLGAAQHAGTAAGSALFGGIFVSRVGHASGSVEAVGKALQSGYTTTLWWAVGSVLLAGLAAGLMITARPGASR